MKPTGMIAMAILFVTSLAAPPLTLADGGGVISACVNQSSGELRIVAAGTTCNKNWTLVQWNATPRTGPATFTIDCDAGQSIQDALGFDFIPGDTLLVTGTCHESVNVSSSAAHRDIRAITIDGQGSATINGTAGNAPAVAIRVRGITLKNFTITGPSDGVGVMSGSTATISGNRIEVGHDGIVVSMGGVATIDGNTIQNSGRFGINLDQNGSARIVNNTVEGSGSHGILVDESSSGRIGFRSFVDAAPGPNIIQHNRGTGVHVVRAASAIVAGNTISGNAGNGVAVVHGSHADVTANTISGNGHGTTPPGHGIYVSENSALNLSQSGLAFEAPNTTTVANTGWGLFCADGAVMRGNRGSLSGTSGTVGNDATCVNRTTAPPPPPAP